MSDSSVKYFGDFVEELVDFFVKLLSFLLRFMHRFPCSGLLRFRRSRRRSRRFRRGCSIGRGAFGLFAHDSGNELLFVLFDARVRILVHQVRLGVLHANPLQVVVEHLIAEALHHVELVRVPMLRENLLHVVLVHAEVHEVDLGAGLADEGAVGDVRVRRLPLIAVDAVGVELVVCDEGDHQGAQLVGLALVEQLQVGGQGALRRGNWSRSVGVR